MAFFIIQHKVSLNTSFSKLFSKLSKHSTNEAIEVEIIHKYVHVALNYI